MGVTLSQVWASSLLTGDPAVDPAVQEAASLLGKRDWLGLGAVACLVLMVFVIPLVDKIKSIVGTAAQPLISSAIAAHNASPDAHSQVLGPITRSIDLLNGISKSLQDQINSGDRIRVESLAGLQRQLDLAIRLLEERDR